MSNGQIMPIGQIKRRKAQFIWRAVSTAISDRQFEKLWLTNMQTRYILFASNAQRKRSTLFNRIQRTGGRCEPGKEKAEGRFGAGRVKQVILHGSSRYRGRVSGVLPGIQVVPRYNYAALRVYLRAVLLLRRRGGHWPPDRGDKLSRRNQYGT